MPKTIGILAHSAEGASLCFLTACHEGSRLLGPHMHPTIALSAIPMALSIPAWERGDYASVAPHLARGVEMLAAAGADFFVCPDNTAHLILHNMIGSLALPGISIVDVVCHEIRRNGWTRAGLLGTRFTMTGHAYADKLAASGVERIVPDETMRARLNAAIFDELCCGVFREETVALFVRAIEDLKRAGAQCVILGCTEIPVIINEGNSPLPILDSTRLLAKYAVREALDDRPIAKSGRWLGVGSG